MKRARPDDTQPMRSAERTDPGGFRSPKPPATAADPARERTAQRIAALARAWDTGRDDTTVSPARETKAWLLWLAVSASAALTVVGIASVGSGSSSVAPIRASVAETARISPAVPAARPAVPVTAPDVEPSPVATAPTLQAPSTNASPPIHAYPESAVHAVKHAPRAPATPANDPTLDELDRVP